MNSGGTQLTATITVKAATLGPRVVVVQTANGESTLTISVADMITVVL